MNKYLLFIIVVLIIFSACSRVGNIGPSDLDSRMEVRNFLPVDWGGRGVSAGDPHFVTYDGLYFDNQFVGEFVLSQLREGEGFRVQARQRHVSIFGGNVSLNTATAILIGQTVIEYRFDDEQLLIDSAEIYLPSGSEIEFDGGKIFRNQSEIMIQNDSQDIKVLLKIHSVYLDIIIALSDTLEDRVEGVFGNKDNSLDDELILRNRKVAKSLAQFMNDWRVRQEESLFNYKPGEDTNTFTEEQTSQIVITEEHINKAVEILKNYLENADKNHPLIGALALDIAVDLPIDQIISWLEKILEVENEIATVYFRDSDQDSLGDPEDYIIAVTPPDGYVTVSGDPEDTVPDDETVESDDDDDDIKKKDKKKDKKNKK